MNFYSGNGWAVPIIQPISREMNHVRRNDIRQNKGQKEIHNEQPAVSVRASKNSRHPLTYTELCIQNGKGFYKVACAAYLRSHRLCDVGSRRALLPRSQAATREAICRVANANEADLRPEHDERTVL